VLQWHRLWACVSARTHLPVFVQIFKVQVPQPIQLLVPSTHHQQQHLGVHTTVTQQHCWHSVHAATQQESVHAATSSII